MTKFALYVPLQAKPGKEQEVADFLRSAVPLVNAEQARSRGLPSKRDPPPSPSSIHLTTRPAGTHISTAKWRRL